MSGVLDDIVYIFSNGNCIHKDDDLAVVQIFVDSICKLKIDILDGAQLVHNIKNENEEVTFSALENIENEITFVIQKLEEYDFYWNFDDFITKNQFNKPDEFYIEQACSSHLDAENELLKGYYSVLKLIAALSNNSRFKKEEFGEKVLFIIIDKSFLELPITYNFQSIKDSAERSVSGSMEAIAASLSENSEKQLLFCNELIDFLADVNVSNRFEYLINNFEEFQSKCSASYEFYLSSFSYSKLKLEIDGVVLDFSKNVRTVINDSQGRLIAVPAAVLVAITQMETNRNSTFGFKNWGIIASSLLFAYLMDMFIVNQKSALSIVMENIKNYKSRFLIKNNPQNSIESENIATILTNSFEPIAKELENQEDRLSTLQSLNWIVPSAIAIVMVLIWTGTIKI